MQNLGVLFIVGPSLKRIYNNDKDGYRRAVARNLEAFNSNPVMSTYSIGAMIKQEEKISACLNEQDRYDEEREWRIIKIGTANTAASLGDRLFWATLKPLSLVLCFVVLFGVEADVLQEEVFQGELLFVVFLALAGSFLLYNLPALAARYGGLVYSYGGDEENFYGLVKINWNKIIYFLKTLGQIFTVIVIFYGLYIRFKGTTLDPDTITRLSLLIAFIILSIFMRKLNIPNIFLYLIATVVFSVASFLA
jgi:mannose/fructose/N-acetylgalactosamine-specific phosphotransferase system component IID